VEEEHEQTELWARWADNCWLHAQSCTTVAVHCSKQLLQWTLQWQRDCVRDGATKRSRKKPECNSISLLLWAAPITLQRPKWIGQFSCSFSFSFSGWRAQLQKATAKWAQLVPLVERRASSVDWRLARRAGRPVRSSGKTRPDKRRSQRCTGRSRPQGGSWHLEGSLFRN